MKLLEAKELTILWSKGQYQYSEIARERTCYIEKREKKQNGKRWYYRTPISFQRITGG